MIDRERTFGDPRLPSDRDPLRCLSTENKLHLHTKHSWITSMSHDALPHLIDSIMTSTFKTVTVVSVLISPPRPETRLQILSTQYCHQSHSPFYITWPEQHAYYMQGQYRSCTLTVRLALHSQIRLIAQITHLVMEWMITIVQHRKPLSFIIITNTSSIRCAITHTANVVMYDHHLNSHQKITFPSYKISSTSA
jgi:hypothetical protein